MPSRRRSNGVLVPRELEYSSEIRVEEFDDGGDAPVEVDADGHAIPATAHVHEWATSPRRRSSASLDSSRSRSSTQLALVHEGTLARGCVLLWVSVLRLFLVMVNASAFDLVVVGEASSGR